MKVILLFGLLASAHSMIPFDEDSIVDINEVPSRVGKILGGVNGTHGGVASVQMVLPQGNVHICGSFIVNKRWLSTAAQCVHDKTVKNIVVVTTITSAAVLTLSQIVVHEEFNEWTLFNDIALLKTSSDIVFNSAVYALAMDPNDIYTTQKVTIYGWGKTGSCVQTNALMKQDFTIKTLDACRNAFSVMLKRFITEENLCTQFASMATCPGDAGGPVLFNNTVIAIASWVQTCTAGTMNVNLKIAPYFPWITKITGVVN